MIEPASETPATTPPVISHAVAHVAVSSSRRKRVRLEENIARSLLFLCASISVLTTIGIVLILLNESVGFFQKAAGLKEVSLLAMVKEFLTGTQWTPLFSDKHFGVLPLVAGTLLTSGIALLIAGPLGLITAVYLSEYAHPRARQVVKPVLEVLAGIPTVVYGYFALIFVTPLLQKLFPGASIEGFNALAPGIVMGLMILPTIASLSEDALYAVPSSLRNGSLSLGATRFQTVWGVVVPAAVSGISASFLLGISRAIGETMIVAIAAGSQPNWTMNPLESIATMTAYIVSVSKGDTPRGTLEYQTIFAVGLLLFIMTLALNLISDMIRQRYKGARL
ncbi:MAG: phosphate ABC transporter permease subunit PstC [Fimbriimonadia bacterium]|nr:phosphate ABC transporter permease subunit PstC [Fimbriimonadia bacterium]